MDWNADMLLSQSHHRQDAIAPPSDHSLALPEVYLHAGQTHASPEPMILSMILGSCVGVCLFEQQMAIGGATHFMLPLWSGDGQRTSRYGDIAIAALIEQLNSLGCKTANLKAKIFGGACMFQSLREKGGDHIGSRNATIALEILSRHSIPVLANDTGGELGRKVRMWTNSGQTTVAVVGN
ncbi:MAG: chemotaxis protein CheD [Acidobacteriia bacterium]|nr:chemotaxis protein CheD [Terriglobia bacterium]